jgi:DNA-binding response OmpR family regulator
VPGDPAAPTTGRRPTARPRRATPARRAPANVEQPDVTEPAEPEPEPEPEGQAEWLVVGRVRLSRRTGDVFSGTRRISLSPAQFAVLELLMTRGGHGVTRDAIRAAAAATGANGEEAPDLDNVEDLDAFVAELRRKTGISGRGQGVRQERANVYFFGE